MTLTAIQLIGALLFAVAILHTFATKFFERLSHTHPTHAGLWHLLGEVEVVFGFWALVLVVAMLRFYVLVKRINSSSRRLLFVRIERTWMLAALSAANTWFRFIARGMLKSNV